MNIVITRSRLILIALGLALVAAGLILAGCSNKITQPWNDAPRTAVINNQPADIIAMPDGFNNMATKCDHGNRLYVSFHSNGAYGFGMVVSADPTCK